MKNCCHDYDDYCSTNINQAVEVNLPVTLKPDISVGRIKVRCCEKPIITYRQARNNGCECEITVTQTLSYKIPIEYSFDSSLGCVTSESKQECRPHCSRED